MRRIWCILTVFLFLLNASWSLAAQETLFESVQEMDGQVGTSKGADDRLTTYTNFVRQNNNNDELYLAKSKTVESWFDATSYILGKQVFVGLDVYTCTAPHLSSSTTQPGVGASWATAWSFTGKLLTQTQADAISANTLKVGITTQQAADITANNEKISFDATSSTRLANTSGENTGDQDLSGKQDALVSGTNIKTINGTSVLGSGDIVVEGGAALEQVYNATGSLIPLGTVVAITGSTGVYPMVTVADKDIDAEVAGIVVDAAIGAATVGFIQASGTLSAAYINTFGMTAGTPLYLGDSGSYTSTKPTTGNIIQIGQVGAVASSSGSLLLDLPAHVQNYEDLINPPTIPTVNTLATTTLTCAEGQVAKLLSGVWTCAADAIGAEGTGDMILNTPQTVTAEKLFNPSTLGVKGSSTGKTTFTSANISAIDNALVFPAESGNIARVSDIPSILQTVRPTGTGSATAVPSEVAVGDALALKLNSADAPYTDFDPGTLTKTGTGTLIDPVIVSVKSNTFATKKADTHTAQFAFNSSELTASPAITAPDGHMIFEVPVAVNWVSGELVCNNTTTTGLQITVASSPAADGTLTPYSSTIGTEGSIDVSGWANPSVGTNISAWVNTASTGDATWCRLIFTLSN